MASGNLDNLAAKIASKPSGAISSAARAKSATFKQPNRQGGGETNRFPMPDAKHARLALQMLPRAKNMPPGMAAKVRGRAQRILGQS